jgi:lanthanide-dependent methanol dehydrogenase
VVFYGTMEGWFKAVSAETGELLWQFRTGSGIIGQPITYRGADGHQYVAVLSGVGGWAGAIVAGDLDPRDGTAALGFVNAMADLKDATTKGGSLYVFRLP